MKPAESASSAQVLEKTQPEQYDLSRRERIESLPTRSQLLLQICSAAL